MKELIDEFIEGVFSDEYIANINRSFSLFEAFEHQNAYMGMVDIILDESVDNLENRADKFTLELIKQLDYVINEHLIKLTEEATVYDKIVVLDALYRLQHLEDYTVIETILSTDDDDIDKLSLILEQICEYDQSYLLTLIESVQTQSMTLLNEYIKSKQNEESIIKPNKYIIDRFKLLVQAYGTEHIGYDLAIAGMGVGYPIDIYLPFVEDLLYIKDDLEQTGLNILSIFYISDIEDNNIITTYRSLSDKILKSVDLSGRVEGVLIKLINRVDEFRKTNKEKVEHEQT